MTYLTPVRAGLVADSFLRETSVPQRIAESHGSAEWFIEVHELGPGSSGDLRDG
jgi:hypothetical protein